MDRVQAPVFETLTTKSRRIKQTIRLLIYTAYHFYLYCSDCAAFASRTEANLVATVTKRLHVV